MFALYVQLDIIFKPVPIVMVTILFNAINALLTVLHAVPQVMFAKLVLLIQFFRMVVVCHWLMLIAKKQIVMDVLFVIMDSI